MKTYLISCGLLLTATLAAQSPASSTPRLPDGRPDLNGTWIPAGGGRGGALKLPDGSICVTGCADRLPPAPAAAGRGGARGAGGPPPRNFPKYKPEYLAKVKELDDNQVKFDTGLRCQPPGVPRIGPPAKIVQTAKEVVFLYDDLNGPFFRIIPIDGRAHRPVSDGRTYLGDAVGKWEGDTLVVETTNFNEDTWLIDNGALHTRDLRVVETLRRTGDKLDAQDASRSRRTRRTVGGQAQDSADQRSGDRRATSVRGSGSRTRGQRRSSRQREMRAAVQQPCDLMYSS
jgi:hypothetical protein